ncbi:uncharacterized protein SPSK_07985 [Sporothrix schenckii 1099-18]|uniref:Uncharacterized protein n=1 Tax=Sporothrix schenckii 1099-18 TaxID=1397361 RepID=A0A0F2ML40_SPOSC|nr:uncharacterized protein SPSK_07985 [Sporothrix schenckii 1099-18]KJR88906.1 hypothetical protein SPSK_07985 [Sporothrix schenckii 1099-18]
MSAVLTGAAQTRFCDGQGPLAGCLPFGKSRRTIGQNKKERRAWCDTSTVSSNAEDERIGAWVVQVLLREWPGRADSRNKRHLQTPPMFSIKLQVNTMSTQHRQRPGQASKRQTGNGNLAVACAPQGGILPEAPLQNRRVPGDCAAAIGQVFETTPKSTNEAAQIAQQCPVRAKTVARNHPTQAPPGMQSRSPPFQIWHWQAVGTQRHWVASSVS